MDKKAVEKLAVEILAVDELAVDKLAVDKLAVDKLAVDKLAVDKLTVWYISSIPVEHGDWSQGFFLNEQLWFVFISWLIWIYFNKCYN